MTWPIRDGLDVFDARRHARYFAARLGFGRLDQGEITLLVSELASNILKYGVEGTITLEAIDDPDRGPGLHIVAWDRGPPIHQFEVAVLDGHDDTGPLDPAALWGRRGIGGGLGTIGRLGDVFSHHHDGSGKYISVQRFRRHP